MRRRRIRANREQLDRVRRAINIAEAEDWLGLRKREFVVSNLAREAYVRTRDKLERRRAEMFPRLTKRQQ